MPSGVETISRLVISAGASIKPSVSAKPTAKSSKSAGVAIITAWAVPLNVKAIADSSGTERTEADTSPLRHERQATLCEGGAGHALAFCRQPVKARASITSSTQNASSSCLMPADKVGWVTPQLSAARLKLRSRQRYQEFELVNHRDAPVRTGKFCAPKAASRRAKAVTNAAWLQARVFAEVWAPVA
jgi:hypothetical protein